MGMLNKRIGFFGQILAHVPFAYNGILKSTVGDDFKTLLDVGCGTGIPMEVINKKNKFDVTGVDIYKPYLKECVDKGVYTKLVESDIRKLKFKDKSFDVVICFHVIEHLTTKEGIALIKNMERMAKKRVVLAMPVGHLHQEEYDGNHHQEHKSAWYPEDLQKLGYNVVGQGLKVLYGEKNVVEKYGSFANMFFLTSMLFQPLLVMKPEYAVYMFAKKDIK